MDYSTKGYLVPFLTANTLKVAFTYEEVWSVYGKILFMNTIMSEISPYLKNFQNLGQKFSLG